MTWFTIVACIVGFLVVGLFASTWFVFRILFGNWKPSERTLVRIEEIDESRKAFRQELSAARAWINAQHPEELEIKLRDGTILRGLLIYAGNQSNSFVIGVHGYKSSKISDIALTASYYYEKGKNLLLVDNRAHGQSGGKYTGFAWLDRFDIIEWCRYLVKRFGPDIKMMLHGISMGASASCCAAAEPDLPGQVLGVVSDCGYSSAWRQIKRTACSSAGIWVLPALGITNLFCRVCARYNLRDIEVAQRVKHAKIPFLFIHGGADHFVPTEMVYELYEACQTEKSLFIVPEAKHGLSWLVDPEGYQERLDAFMRKIGI